MRYKVCNRATAAPQMNVLCFDTRIRFLRGSCWRKVARRPSLKRSTELTSSSGIDVQAELQVKTGSPALGPSYHPTTAAPSPLQRTAMNRQHARRSGQVMAPRALQGSVLAHPAHNEVTFSARSPPGGPTPSSHTSSPSAFSVKSPGMMPTTDTLTPPLSATQGLGPVQSQVQGQPQQYRPQQPQHRAQYAMQQPPQRPTPPPQYSGSSGMSSATSGSTRVGVMTGGSNNGYYTTPFQKHIDQLGKLPRPLLLS